MTPRDACPEPTRLKDLLDGTLPEVERVVLTEHLETCASCQHMLEEFAAGSETWSKAARQRDSGAGGPGVADPALLRVMEQAKAEGIAGESRTEPAAEGAPALDFLGPPRTPGHLGRLGHYEIIEVVGQGGMGMVLRGFDEALHRIVAIKVMAPRLAASGVARRRFIREAQAAAAVVNDYVITIHSVEEADGLPYLVMSFIAGDSLQERLDRGDSCELREILRIGMQVAYGLSAAHAQGLIHRDIKPSNILLENAVQRVKITDFGLARAVDDASLTQSGVVAGTPLYMAPEQARGEPMDHRADLFSLGSVIYALCTGRPPFRASSAMAVLKRVCEDTPRAIREINPDIPYWMVAIIDRLHEKDRAKRFQSAGEVAELLGRHLAELQQPSVIPAPPPRPKLTTSRVRQRIWIVAVLGLLVVALVSVILASLGRSKQGPAHPFDHERAAIGEAEGRRNSQPDSQLIALPSRPFAILARDDRHERTFATLSSAVADAGSGDTIEIRGNGPFAVNPIWLGHRALRIRAGRGIRPVIILDPNFVPNRSDIMLQTAALLVLEGLEVRREGRTPPGTGEISIMSSFGAPIYAANCRFSLSGFGGTIVLHDSPSVELRNCEIVSAGYGCVSWELPQAGHFVLANCVLLAVGPGIVFPSNQSDLRRLAIRLQDNTIVGAQSIQFMLHRIPKLPAADAGRPIDLSVSGNILRAHDVIFQLLQERSLVESSKPLSTTEARALLPRLADWAGRNNLYETINFLGLAVHREVIHGESAIGALIDWGHYWGSREDDSLQGKSRFRGGDLWSRLSDAPSSLAAADFRLKADSPGHRAGEGGRDLGANIDLVGPGPAYELWKLTPAYRDWGLIADRLLADSG